MPNRKRLRYLKIVKTDVSVTGKPFERYSLILPYGQSLGFFPLNADGYDQAFEHALRLEPIFRAGIDWKKKVDKANESKRLRKKLDK